MPALSLEVRFHSVRYHGLNTEGRPEWPPSPARLFQALIAGAAKGAVLCKEDRDAFAWLEQLEAPFIATPAVRKGQSFRHFMPNNDLDSVGGDPTRIGDIRTATKRFHPQIFDLEIPFFYVWSFTHGAEHAERMCDVAERLYQLGRGVDMAWAVAEVLDVDEAEARLFAYPGAIYRPAANSGGRVLACPLPGSLNSLFDRYKKSRTRFKTTIEPAPTKKDPSRMKMTGQTFSQPPKPRFRQVSYDSSPVWRLYELRDMTESAGFFPQPLRKAAWLVETVRNGAASRLKEKLPGKADTIARIFGLCRDSTEADKASRIRIIPLPSIGHQHADHGIRRLLVEIPINCPVTAGDIAWAFSVTGGINESTGKISWMLVTAVEEGMLNHYGIGNGNQSGFRHWRTVTPMALPVARPHGRKEGIERADIERGAEAAVAQALRHAGITVKPASIRVQREPLDMKGSRAEIFAPGTRFASARLWHVEITFAQPFSGPLLAGDGRYLGLGLMRPVKRVEGVLAFVVVNGLSPLAGSQSVTRALRRAVMALVQNRIGKQALDMFFTGHEADGSPTRQGGRSHLAFVFDQARQRLLVIAPHLLEGRRPSQVECKHLRLLDAALADLRELRAGSAGLLRLEPSTIIEDDDPLFAHAKTWMTQTDYSPIRHRKGATPEQAIIADIRIELRRYGCPIPTSIDKISVCRGPRGGLSAQLRLVFSTAVGGPLLLGKARNFGRGLFVGAR